MKNGSKGMTNVEGLLRQSRRNWRRATRIIALSIKDAVIAALQAKHPKRFTRTGVGIIVRKLIDSSMRLVPVPAISEYDGPSASPAAPSAIQVPDRRPPGRGGRYSARRCPY